MSGRDSKGRFVKGNTEGVKYREGDGRLSERERGGESFAEKCASRRTYREIFNALRDIEIEVPMPDGTKVKRTLDEAEMIALHRRAATGDTRALKLVLDMTGEIEQNINIKTDDAGLLIKFDKE